MSNRVLLEQIQELKKSIITKGMEQFTVSNLEKVRKLEELIRKLDNNEKI